MAQRFRERKNVVALAEKRLNLSIKFTIKK